MSIDGALKNVLAGWPNRYIQKQKSIYGLIADYDVTIKEQAYKNEQLKKENEMTTMNKILEERKKTHGDFASMSTTAWSIRNAIYSGNNVFTPIMQEAINMIVHKLSRIVHGDPAEIDHWQDIAGYAQLVVNGLEKTYEKPSTCGKCGKLIGPKDLDVILCNHCYNKINPKRFEDTFRVIHSQINDFEQWKKENL